jgi:YVTN family beta-propeller protein
VGLHPNAIAVNPVTNKIYVAENPYQYGNNTVEVLDGASNKVLTSISLAGEHPGLAVDASSNRIYITHDSANASSPSSVFVMDGSTNKVVANVGVGSLPTGVAIQVPGTTIIVIDSASNEISVVDGRTNVLKATITVGGFPDAVATDSGMAFVANLGSDTITVVRA